MGTQGFFHAGNHAAHRPLKLYANVHHGFCQVHGIGQGGHQGTGTYFHIQHDGFGAGSEFFAQNAGGDQGNGIHRAGHIPQGVEPFIGRGQVFALAHHTAAHFPHDLHKAVFVKLHLHAFNAFQLIHRAAGMAKPPAAHLQHFAAAGSNQRSQYQSGGIAHAAGGMLIQRNAVHIRLQHGAAAGHFPGEGSCFFDGHAIEPDGHQKGGQLIIRQAAVCCTLHKKADFIFCKALMLFLVFNDRKNIHTFIHPLYSAYPFLLQ